MSAGIFTATGIIFLVVFLLIGALFLWVGAKVAKIAGATFGKAFLAALLGVVAGLILGLVPAIGWLLGIIAYIIIIKYVFNTDWGKAIIAWLIAFVASLIVGFILAKVFGITLFALGKAGASAGMLYLLT